MTKQTCGICWSELLAGNLNVTCNGPCKEAFHALCACLDRELLNAGIAENGSLWSCRSCRLDPEGENQQREWVLQAVIPRMHGEIQKVINAKVQQIKMMLPAAAVKRRFVADSSEPKRYCGEADVSTMSDYPQFPVEIWTKVFKNLDFEDLCQIRLVHSEWKNIVESFLMSKFILTIPITLISILKTYPKLPASTMIFRGSEIFSVGSWWSQPFTKQLANLELNNCKISLMNLLKMLRHTPNLVSLRCCGSTLTYGEAVERFADLKLEKMKKLTLDSVKQDAILECFSKMFPRMTDFTLLSDYRKCHRGVLEMIKALPNMEGISLISSSNHLSHLAGVKHQFKRVSLTIERTKDGNLAEHLISFSQNQRLLECFELCIQRITNNTNINTGSLTTIFQNLLRLKRLSIEINNRGTTVIDLASFGCLTELKYCAFKDLEVLFNGAINPKLEELSLRGTIYPTDLQGYITRASSLRAITLKDCYFNSWSEIITTLIKSKELRRLKLDFVYAGGADDNTIRPSNQCFDELRCLELSKSNLTTEFFSTLLSVCPRLEELHLELMYNNCDALVLVLCQQIKQLRKLTIYNSAITDAAARHITQYALTLDQLTIKYCKDLTTAGITQLKSAKIKTLKVVTSR